MISATKAIKNKPSDNNPCARIVSIIKSLYGKSYKELPDKEFVNIIKIIEWCEKNPQEEDE